MLTLANRLRQMGEMMPEITSFKEAADEIERLHKALAAIQEAAEDGRADECHVMAKVALALAV